MEDCKHVEYDMDGPHCKIGKSKGFQCRRRFGEDCGYYEPKETNKTKKVYSKTIWHKVADGDLPKNANYVLVAYHYYSLVSYAIACYKGQLSNNFRKWSTTDDYFKYDDDVIAWTELPKYEEQENE